MKVCEKCGYEMVVYEDGDVECLVCGGGGFEGVEEISYEESIRRENEWERRWLNGEFYRR